MGNPTLYAGTYRTTKRRWTERIAAEGGALCHRCGEWINAGEPWDLGHDDATGEVRGPEHPKCNRAAGGRKGHELRTKPGYQPRYIRGQHDCPVCGTRVKWEKNRTCGQDCKRLWAAANPTKRTLRTTCNQGHDMANAYVYPNGGRECRTCKREALAKWKAQHPESVRASRKKWKAANA